MSGAGWYGKLLLSIFLLIVNLRTGSIEIKAILPANAPADLRAHPSGERPFKPKFIDADRVTSDELARSRRIDVAAGGRNEPNHINFWKFVDEAAAQSPDSGTGVSEAPMEESKKSTKETAPTAPATAQAPAPGKAPVKNPTQKVPSPTKSIPPVDKPKSKEEEDSPGKSPSILQMLEGHERELMIAAAIAAAFFFIGWICGGNYYLRRDRRRRTKIRF
jgi:uncharacterized membrane protein